MNLNELNQGFSTCKNLSLFLSSRGCVALSSDKNDGFISFTERKIFPLSMNNVKSAAIHQNGTIYALTDGNQVQVLDINKNVIINYATLHKMNENEKIMGMEWVQINRSRKKSTLFVVSSMAIYQLELIFDVNSLNPDQTTENSTHDISQGNLVRIGELDREHQNRFNIVHSISAIGKENAEELSALAICAEQKTQNLEHNIWTEVFHFKTERGVDTFRKDYISRVTIICEMENHLTVFIAKNKQLFVENDLGSIACGLSLDAADSPFSIHLISNGSKNPIVAVVSQQGSILFIDPLNGHTIESYNSTLQNNENVIASNLYSENMSNFEPDGIIVGGNSGSIVLIPAPGKNPIGPISSQQNNSSISLLSPTMLNYAFLVAGGLEISSAMSITFKSQQLLLNPGELISLATHNNNSWTIPVIAHGLSACLTALPKNPKSHINSLISSSNLTDNQEKNSTWWKGFRSGVSASGVIYHGTVLTLTFFNFIKQHFHIKSTDTISPSNKPISENLMRGILLHSALLFCFGILPSYSSCK